MMIGYGNSGATHDFFAFNSAGNVWNGAAFVAWNDANYTTYRIAAAEVGTSGRFTGTDPAGTVTYSLRLRGASLAASPVLWTDGQVLIQSGAAAGQLDFSAGVVKANVTQYNGAAGTFSAGMPTVMLNNEQGDIGFSSIGIVNGLNFAGSGMVIATDGVNCWFAVTDQQGNALATSAQANQIIGYVDTEVAAIKQVTDHLATMIVLSGGTYVFTAPAVANAPSGAVTVAPITATANPQFFATENLPTVAQASAPLITWGIVDSAGNAVNLAGKTVRFVASKSNQSDAAAVFSHDNAAVGGLTITGASNNNVNVQLATADTGNSANLHYWIWNITDNIALVKGTMPIAPAKKTVP